MENRNIINVYKRNDELDIEKIVNTYTTYLYKIIENMDANISQEDIEEVILDTFLILWKNRERLDDARYLSPYLAGICKKVVYKKKRSIKHNINYDITAFENTIVSNEEINSSIEERERNQVIYKELNKLSKEDREIFFLFYYHAKKIKDIASELKINDFTVKTKLHRIRKKLKKSLIEGGY